MAKEHRDKAGAPALSSTNFAQLGAAPLTSVNDPPRPEVLFDAGHRGAPDKADHMSAGNGLIIVTDESLAPPQMSGARS